MGEQPPSDPYRQHESNQWPGQPPHQGQPPYPPQRPYGEQQPYPGQAPTPRTVPSLSLSADVASHRAKHERQDRSSSAGDERQQKLGPHADGVDVAASEAPGVRAHPLWRPTILLVLTLIGLAAGIWAIVIFPSRAPIVYPQPFKISIVSEYSISHVYVSIWSSEQYTYMQVGAAPESAPSTLGNEGYIDIYIVGDIHVKCPSSVACSFSPIQGYQTEQWEIAVPITALPNGHLVSYVVAIEDPRFGPASNGQSATAQLPIVSTAANLPGSAPEIDLAYKVPNADTYDWSTPPALYVSSSWPDWSEQLSSSVSEIPPVAITGTNNAVQAQDNRSTFISGILLGVAGAAAIAFVQEGMHMLIDRRDKQQSIEGRRDH